jgi:hypothetical protein
MKIIFLLITLLFVNCSSGVISTFRPIQTYENRDYAGKYFGNDNWIFHQNVLLSADEKSVRAVYYTQVKGAYFEIYNDELKPVYKKYFFGDRIQFYKNDRAMFYRDEKNENKYYFLFIGIGEKQFEFPGIILLELHKIENKEYELIFNELQIQKKQTSEWWDKDVWQLDNWKIHNAYKNYKNEIILLRDKYRKAVNFDHRVKVMNINEIIELDHNIKRKVLDEIDNKYKVFEK